VTEPEEPETMGFRDNLALSNNALLRFETVNDKDKAVEVDFKKLKLRYEVNVIFALQ
jgi:hypothetical protein